MDGVEGQVLLIASAGVHTGGGLWEFDGHSIRQIDRISCTNLLLHEGIFARLLFSGAATEFGCEMLVYDHYGVKQYHRLDDVFDAHFLAWDGENYIIVSCWRNELVWVSPTGGVVRKWRAPGEVDSWHLNGLCQKDGELYISAFGDFGQHRGWHNDQNKGTGKVWNFHTGADTITGLFCPHNPSFFDGAWHVCNSYQHELLQFAAQSNTPTRKLQLEGWTRGLAISDDYIFVGESAHRHSPSESATGKIAIVSRRNWDVLAHLEIGSEEVGDLVVVPRPIAEGVRKGFRTNPLRVVEQDQNAMFDTVGICPKRLWVVSDPLSADDAKASIELRVPPEMFTGATVELDCCVTNRGSAFFVSAPPFPVNLSYKWVKADTTALAESGASLRTRLIAAHPPGQKKTYRLLVQAPATPGRYQLRVTLVQENVTWFDDLDPMNACQQMVNVLASAMDGANK